MPGAGGQDASGLCGLIAGLSGIERVRWIRLMYAYPSRVGDRLIEMFEKDNKLLRYLDMPVQHASDRILRAMGRRYDSSLLAALVEKLRRRVPGIALRTTVITGFPGETDADYGELYDFLEWAKFERLGVFAYSREEGTPAARMRGQVAKDVAEKRRAGLLRLQASVMARYESGRIGREYDAIVERSYIKPGERIVRFKARTYAEAPEIDGNISGRADPAQISGGAILAPGSFIRMKITGKNANGLIGALVL